MNTPPLPQLPALLAVGLVAAAFAAAPAPAAAAALIRAPGPWPTAITGAANPLTGTALNGAHATANASLRVWWPAAPSRARTAIAQTFGERTLLRGRLRNRDTNRSIAGAIVTVAVQNVYGSEWTAVANVATSRRGYFRAVLVPGYHRRVAAVYYPSSESSAPLHSRRLLIRTRSRVALRRPFRRGRAVRFDGRVSAGIVPIPTGGLLVALQVRNRRGSWITARLARTRSSGRFRIRYTFDRAPRLTVRVVAPAQTDWPLYAGHSRRWTIRPR